MHRDRIVGVLTTILGAAVAYMTSQLAGTNMPGDPGPKVFPYICAGILLVCGLILTIRKPAGEAKPFLNGKEEVKRFISIILVIAAYIVLMWLFGFLVPTLLVVCLLCFMFAEGKNIPKWQPIVYSIIVTGALYVAFVYMLKLRLPVGTLLFVTSNISKVPLAKLSKSIWPFVAALNVLFYLTARHWQFRRPWHKIIQ